MKVELTNIWRIEATAAEMRLIIASLRGTLKSCDIDLAARLADEITEDRATEANHLAHEMGKHRDNMLSIKDYKVIEPKEQEK